MSDGLFTLVVGVLGLGMGLGLIPGPTWVVGRYVEPSRLTQRDRLTVAILKWVCLVIGALCVVVGLVWMVT